jgi:hypothetical protein
VVLDYDAQDNVVGVEVLHLFKRGGPVEGTRNGADLRCQSSV